MAVAPAAPSAIRERRAHRGFRPVTPACSAAPRRPGDEPRRRCPGRGFTCYRPPPSPRPRPFESREYACSGTSRGGPLQFGQDALKNFPYEALAWSRRDRLTAGCEDPRAGGDAVSFCTIWGGPRGRGAVHRAVGDQLTLLFTITACCARARYRWRTATGIRVNTCDESEAPRPPWLASPSSRRSRRSSAAKASIRSLRGRPEAGHRGGKPPVAEFGTPGTSTSLSQAARVRFNIKSRHNVGGLPEDMTFER